jgi:hypothetical protein
MEKFIKCPGLLKNSLIDKKSINTFVLSKNICGFKTPDKITVAKWKDDLTITMTLTAEEMILEFWISGKRVKAKRWTNKEDIGVLAASINFYELEDYISIEANYDTDLKQFDF